MARKEIRLLKASEIECRTGMVRENGLSLLLYKDARVDQRILDETFGAFGWQRKHTVLNGRLYCTVSIWDREKEQWIEKQDVGTGGDMEKEKGEASDSFKRACFSVGIGRELYTAPFIWVPSTMCRIEKRGDGKYFCREQFRVHSISYGKEKEIAGLTIVDSRKQVVFSFCAGVSAGGLLNQKQKAEFREELERTGVSMEQVLERYRLSAFEEMTPEVYRKAMNGLKKTKSDAA